mmetsp:Transcript_126/g.364  ORF Transcript_126/g.364 Transcript_126/m.364 type:complete len:223 (-) Transcript_126:3095-3763(-)
MREAAGVDEQQRGFGNQHPVHPWVDRMQRVQGRAIHVQACPCHVFRPAAQGPSVDKCVGNGLDFLGHSVLPGEGDNRRGMCLGKASKQGSVQALLLGGRALNEWRQLIVISYEDELISPQEGAHHRRKRDLPGLVYDAHVKVALAQECIRDSKGGNADDGNPRHDLGHIGRGGRSVPVSRGQKLEEPPIHAAGPAQAQKVLKPARYQFQHHVIHRRIGVGNE